MFSIAQYLQTLDYFRPLDAETCAALAQQAYRRTFEPGETIFLENEPAAGLWIIESGRVKIYKLHPDGGEHVLRIFGERDTFNDVGALDGGANPANAAALSAVTAWVLPGPAVQQLLETDGKLALHMVRVLTRRVRALVGQLESLALYSVTVRLARFLLRQVHDPALSGPGVTRAAIAAHLATTPQTISTALRDLEQTGAIEFDRHRILITDETLLRSIALLGDEEPPQSSGL
jgi:CRP/FNR family transcriptional regulator, dissimilatory nitrate respiration regulator